MSKLSFSSLFKIFSPKLLFIFCFVFVFSFSQVNYSSADNNAVPIPGVTIEEQNRESAAFAARESSSSSSLDPCSSVGAISSALVGLLACEIWLVATKFVLQISAEFANLSASLFDFSTQKFVLQISTMFKNDDGTDGEFIYGGWSVIRDLANIAAFFGAVYTGFRYITGSDSLDFKKAVTKLILYSILVNFSFPIAKFLIDISNVISLQIYGGITEYTAGANELSKKVLSSMNLNSLISQVGSANPNFKGFSTFTLMWLSIVYLLAAFGVFLYASLMILVRSFILLACVILSPLMFLNFAFPKLTELHEKWRENFFGQLFFAPVLMFGFWLSFILLQAATLDTTPVSGQAADSLTSYANVASLINMLLAIISLFVTVKLASSISGGAGKSISGMVGGGMKNLGLAATTGGAGLAFRGTVGRMGSAMASSNWVKNTGKENGATRRMAASLASGAGNKMSSYKLAGTKSFDEKKNGNVKGAKDEARDQHGQSLKDTGLTDKLAQATSAKEVQMVLEEMKNIQSNPNHKRNNDLFGRDAKEKAKEADQSVRKEMRLGNVSGGNRAEYRELSNKINQKSEFDKGDDNTELRNQRLARAKELRGDRLESLKNTSTSQVFANNVGAASGVVYDAVTDNAVTRGVGKVTDTLIVNPLKKVAELGDRPSLAAGIARNIKEGFQKSSDLRGKKVSNQNSGAESSAPSQTTAQAAEPKQTVATNAVTGASSRG